MKGRRCSRGLLRPSRRLPWKATPGKARWVRAVCTNPGCLWKGLRGRFFRLYDSAVDEFAARLARPCQKFHKGPACGHKTRRKRHLRGERHGPRLGSPLGSPLTPPSAPLRALEDAFHAMVARSRAEPAPGLAERLDRLARLRTVVADNEERFRQAISADFGHRCAVETTIAETMMVFSEIRHATKHLKSWMAPQRVADRAAIFARAQPADAAAARRRRHHRALELSAPADAGARDRRARRRQPCHHQAERTRRPLLRAAEGDGRRRDSTLRSCSSPASRTRSQRPSRACRSIISCSPARRGSGGWSRRPRGAI